MDGPPQLKAVSSDLAVGCCVGESVDGVFVGEQVGKKVGINDGETVGCLADDNVEGTSVGKYVGRLVGDAVGLLLSHK